MLRLLMSDKFISFGNYGQCVASFIASFGSLVSGIMVGWPDAVIPNLRDGSAGFTFSEREVSLMLTFSAIGGFVAPIPSAYVIDRIGRRNSMVAFTVTIHCAWALLYFSQNVLIIYFAMFLTGIWVSFEFCAVGVYICEITEHKIRGKWASFAETMYFTGVLYTSLVSRCDYYVIILACACPSVTLVLALMIIPESPYYYLLKGDRRSASRSIMWLRGEVIKEELDSMEDTIMIQTRSKSSYSEIFLSRKNLISFLLLQFLVVVNGNSSMAVLSTFSTILLPDSWASPQTGFTILCCTWTVSAMVGIFVIESVDRKILLYVSSFGAALALTCTSVWYYLRGGAICISPIDGMIPIVLLIISGFFETSGIQGVQNVFMGEIFPHSIKTKAVALSSMTMSLVDGINMFFFYDMTNGIGMYFCFAKGAFTSISCVFFAKYYMVETRGKTLEELQTLLKNKNCEGSVQENYTLCAEDIMFEDTISKK